MVRAYGRQNKSPMKGNVPWLSKTPSAGGSGLRKNLGGAVGGGAITAGCD